MVESGQDVQPTEAITKSRQLMDGHKWEFFVLQLSFIGWGILACITFVIGFLWLKPYVQMTNAKYYRQLAGDQFKGGQEVHNDSAETAAPTAEPTEPEAKSSDKPVQTEKTKQNEQDDEPTQPDSEQTKSDD